MKNKIKATVVVVLLVGSLALSACSNMRWGANAGVDVNFGPHGPRLDPHVGVDLYSGGRR